MTNMYSMFEYAYRFDGDLSDWDVSSVKDMGYMFRNARSWNGDVSRWDVSSVTNMYSMFFHSNAWTGCDLSDWDVSNVEWFGWAFGNAITFDGNMSGWNVSNVRTKGGFYKMFESPYNFRGIGLESWTFDPSWSLDDFNRSGLWDMTAGEGFSFMGDITRWPYVDQMELVDQMEPFRYNMNAYNCSQYTNLSSCTMNGCTAAAMARPHIPHGGHGDCGDKDLDHLGTCTPECDNGYEASGHMVCYGSYAINSFECKPIETCFGADTDPDDGTKGDCPASLAQGEFCTPACDEGFTGYGHRLCQLGRVIDAFKCVADPEICRIETPEEPTSAPVTEAPETQAPETQAPDGRSSGQPLVAAVVPAFLGWVTLAFILPVM